MVSKFKKKVEKVVEGGLFVSSTITSLTVIFIIIFLFKEGLGLFNSTPTEPHYTLAVNANNPVGKLNSKQLKDIFNGDITN